MIKNVLIAVFVLIVLYMASWFFNHVHPFAGFAIALGLLIAAIAYFNRQISINNFKEKQNEKK